jgi:integrase
MAVKRREWTNKDGSTSTAYQVGYNDASGKWRTRTYDRKKNADAFFETTKREVRLGVHVTDQDTVTVQVGCQKWLTTCELDGLETSTRAQYRGHVHNHIVPAKLGDKNPIVLGDVLLTRLSRPLITDFRDHLLKANSHATARKIWVSFKAMLSDAEARGLIGHNPASSIFIKEDERGYMQDMALRVFPQPAEIRAIIEAATGLRMKTLLTAAAFAGLRSSELRGLHWEDCDFDKHRLNVRRRANLKNVIGPLKSKAAHRSIPMTPELETALRKWRIACPRRDGKLVLVFPNGLGKVQAHNHLVEWGVYPVQIAAGIVTPRLGPDGQPVIGEDGHPVIIAKYGLHDLRHFFASWLINELRCNPNKVKALVGHSSIKLTYDIYGHLFDDDDGDNLAFAAGSERVMSAPSAAQAVEHRA